MTRTYRTPRLAVLAISTVLAAGGALLPSTALAAPATPQVVTVSAVAAGHQQHLPTSSNKNTTTVTISTTTKQDLPDGRVKVTTTKKIIKTTRNAEGHVVKKTIQTKVRVFFVSDDENDNNNQNNNRPMQQGGGGD